MGPQKKLLTGIIMRKLVAAAYYSGIPARNNNAEKPAILDNFLKGVSACQDEALAVRNFNLVESDIALIQGFVHEDGKTLPHLILRKNVLDYQQKNRKKTLIVDSNLFLYADPENKNRYLRYSFDGVFPTTGYYFDKEVDPTRWISIGNRLGISLKPWRTSGDYILICLQRNGGWSMKGLNVLSWLDETILKIRQHNKRIPIIVRPHPGDKKIKNLLKINHKNVTLSNKNDLRDDLRNAWATVVYNSSPAVASSIEGVPVFVTDPNSESSQSKDIANTDLSKINDPDMPDRQKWIERLAMCHWNFDELSNGTAWRFFRRHYLMLAQ